MTFFPIEEEVELIQLRALLSPFMKNVRKCVELNGGNHNERERICTAIINTASSQVDNELINRLNRVMIGADNRTINLEHDRLRAMNIRFSYNDDKLKLINYF